MRAITTIGLVIWALESLSGSPAYPLKASANNVYLVDQNNTATLVLGDTAWSLMVALNQSEVGTYLDSRQAKGFNAVIANLIEHYYPGGDNPYLAPTNRYGVRPFSTPGDFSTPVESYFTNVDWIIDQCATRGMNVFLVPCYLGYPGDTEGWYNEVVAQGTNAMHSWGQWVGNRYKGKANIIWVAGGDRNPGDVYNHVNMMSIGIKETDTNHLITAHTESHQVSTDQYPSTTWLNLNGGYAAAGSWTYDVAWSGFYDSPTLPSVMLESTYEGNGGLTETQTRAEAYGSTFSGMWNYIFGKGGLWRFLTGWQSTHLDTTVAGQMVHMKNLLLSRPWYSLVPDYSNLTVTVGYSSGWAFVACSRETDGKTVLIYFPSSAGQITVDMSRISGATAKGYWFSPQAGTNYVDGTYATSGTRNFTAPDSNDWVLVLDDMSQGYAEPGTLAGEGETAGHVQVTGTVRAGQVRTP